MNLKCSIGDKMRYLINASKAKWFYHFIFIINYNRG